MFQKKIIEKYLSRIEKQILEEQYNIFCSIFGKEEKQENIRSLKEEQYQEGFLRDLFCQVLGYTIKPELNFNILTELKNESKSNAKKSDGAIIINGTVKAVIELKGTDTQDLDKVAFQAFSYKNHHEKCNYVIVSNFERLRIYVETQIEYIEFNLFNLTKDKFDLLYLLLSLDSITNDIPLHLKQETFSEEKEITDKFYADYSTFKRCLFEDLIENNPDTDKLLLFKKTQKLLDRILFVLFCEDKNLLPANSAMGIINDYKKLKELGYYQPLYSVFKTFFDRVNRGFSHETDASRNIFAYNGGLFKHDEILDAVKISDDVLFIHTQHLANYDFESQISVDILGRIFENSLTEIEEVQKQIEDEKKGIKSESTNIGKRKKDGVFYTPEYITKYIVENTIGKLCQAKKDELKINDTEFTSDKRFQKKTIEELDKRLNSYREWLLTLKILDPACGSGAFLNAALKELRKEHSLIDSFWSKIHKNELNFFQIDTTILENNLYGVDINEDSIEITKLSLWLNTATRNRKLTSLNDKIKCGNSLIDDQTVAGEKAFNWEKEFPEVFEKGGFDVVIGNPPYVRIQTLNERDVFFYNTKYADIVSGNYDLYILFLYRGFSLLKENGYLGFILPNKFFTSENGIKIRNYLSQKECVNEIDDFTTNQLFFGATTYTTLLFLQNSKHNTFHYRKIELGEDFINFSNKDKILFENSILSNDTWIFSNQRVNALINKIKSQDFTLKTMTKKIFKGSSSGNDKIFLLNIVEEKKNSLLVKSAIESNMFEIEKGMVKPFIYGEDVKRYLQPFINKCVIFPYKLDENNTMSLMTLKEIKDNYPLCFNYLEKHKSELLKRKIPLNEGNYFKYSAARNLNEYENVKILIPDMLVKNRITYDKSALIYHNAMIHSIIFNDKFKKIDFRVYLILLNSSVFWFFITNTSTALSGNAYRLTPEYLNPFGIPDLTEDKFKNLNNELCLIADKMLSLNADLQKKINRFVERIQETYNIQKVTQNLSTFYKLSFTDLIKELTKQKVKLSLKQKDELEDYFNDYVKDISTLNQTIFQTDKEINNLVYKLYNLNDEEIKIIEKG